MNSEDRNNLQFLLALKERGEWDHWINSLPKDEALDSIEYASNLMRVYDAELDYNDVFAQCIESDLEALDGNYSAARLVIDHLLRK